MVFLIFIWLLFLSDKMNRLITLAYGKDVNMLTGNTGETVCDTLIDIENYANIGIMLIENIWEHKEK